MNSSRSYLGLIILVGSVLTYACLYRLFVFQAQAPLPLVSSMNIHSIVTNPPGGGVTKYHFVKEDNAALTYIDAMNLLATGDEEFIGMINAAIISHPSKALFWECTSFTANTASNIPFEFVLIPSSRLENIVTDMMPFRTHFDGYRQSETAQLSTEEVISFQSLGKDALLVVPCPPDLNNLTTNSAGMAHLTSFIRTASPAHREALWRKVGISVLDTLSSAAVSPDTRFWLSTSGLGVSWLHVRIDTVPKYYNWEEYKNVAS